MTLAVQFTHRLEPLELLRSEHGCQLLVHLLAGGCGGGPPLVDFDHHPTDFGGIGVAGLDRLVHLPQQVADSFELPPHLALVAGANLAPFFDLLIVEVEEADHAIEPLFPPLLQMRAAAATVPLMNPALPVPRFRPTVGSRHARQRHDGHQHPTRYLPSLHRFVPSFGSSVSSRVRLASGGEMREPPIGLQRSRGRLARPAARCNLTAVRCISLVEAAVIATAATAAPKIMYAWALPMTAGFAPVDASEEARLVVAARDGDRDAFTRLVEQHQQRVFRLAGRFFRQRADVEEAAQETFLTAWRKLSSYRAEAPFEHWLTRVCLNCCYQLLRRAKPSEELDSELPDRSAGPEARLDAERLLSHLDSRDRFLLQLLHGEGWTTAEIAERLGWSVSNVKVRAFRARRKLRALLEEETP